MQKEEEGQVMKTTTIPTLSQDVITEILYRVVPPQSLYVELRFVCKSWFDIITSTDFQRKHPVTKEPPCLIIQSLNYSSYTRLLAYNNDYMSEDQANTLIDQAKRLAHIHTEPCIPVGEGRVRVSDLTSVLDALRLADPYTTCSIQVGLEGILKQVDLADSGFCKQLGIMACCNGLMIVRPRCSPPDTLYVVNIITKQNVKLPPPPYIISVYELQDPTLGFTFVPSTGEYKVVLLRNSEEKRDSKKVVLLPDSGKEGDSNKRKRRRSKKRKGREREREIIVIHRDILILTFGGSSDGSSSYDDLHWKVVQAPQMDGYHIAPIAVDGFLYWERSHWWSRAINCFDAKEERFCKIYGAGDYPSKAQYGKEGLFEMAGNLACWIDHDGQLDFWTLKNFRGGGEWTKYSTMRFDDQYIKESINSVRMLLPLLPILSYENGEVIIFYDKVGGNLWAYNMTLNIWWKMENNSYKSGKVGDVMVFSGFHVNKTAFEFPLGGKATSITN